MPYANVDPRQWTPAHRDENPVPLVIHAPTHRGVKGSEFVFRAVERLRKEHIRFEFELIENLSHTEARTLYDRADLLVDQLLIGWYGGLAVELMALGKPVVCYLREDDLAFIPPAMRKDLPIIPASPHDIYEVLKRMLTVPRVELQKIGQRSRAFVEEWHDPIKVVQHVISDYHTITRKRRFSALFR
jgi:glycosyltransferase involved in cell wall biosynthesis